MKAERLFKKRIGILGGGQLGKMLCSSASPWHPEIFILDPSAGCPAAAFCTRLYTGDYRDYDTVYRFGQLVDVLTIEVEDVNTDALLRLAEEGKPIFPDPVKVRLIQDKGLQREVLAGCDLPGPDFRLCTGRQHIETLLNGGYLQYPVVQKLRRSGYDGKGVAVINSPADLVKLLDGPSVVESKVAIRKEISVITARDQQGNVCCYTPVEMVFDPDANLVKYLLCPAEIDERTAARARELAIKATQAFGIVGLLAVEMFLDERGELLVNEVAPRPHNSGHHTIETAITSQYEQHLRAILGLPLGSVELLSPSVMINLLGEPGYEGAAVYQGLDECLAMAGAKVHLYGKEETRPYRKMGHITIVDRQLAGAKEKAEIVGKKLKVIA